MNHQEHCRSLFQQLPVCNSIISKPAKNLFVAFVDPARSVIPENHSFVAHMKGLQATFDQEVKRANDAEAQLEALQTKLVEEQTTNEARQSLIEAKERQVVMLQGQLVKLQPFLDGLREQLEPTKVIIDGISRHGQGDKRQREEDGGDQNGRGEGSSKRLRG